MMQPALYWKSWGQGSVRCELCPHACVIREGAVGRCGSRQVSGGRLKALGYGQISSCHYDPIEKKPLYHFYPGSLVLSLGGWGCNFTCSFCQNWGISQSHSWSDEAVEPAVMVQAGKKRGSVGMAYTYNEPVINFEFVMECARLARAEGLVNVLVTNGFMAEKPAAELLPLIDAVNVDIKSMDPEFYCSQCKGALDPVLNFCRQAGAADCHIEITNLLITGLNDQVAQVGPLADWIRENLGECVPLHLSAYHPDFKMDRPPTPMRTLENAWKRCRESLSYVYMGNVMSCEGQDMRCPGCGATLIARQGYDISLTGLNKAACRACGRKADGVFVRP